MAEVYWIRLPEHQNVSSEGYIGITSKTAKGRFIEHINSSNLNKKKHLKISYAIKKHGAENLILDVLVICEDEYALWLEEKLRPSENIGWNLAKGGSKPPVRSGPMSTEFSLKLSLANKGRKVSQETRNKISATLKGSVLSQQAKLNISEGNKKRIAEFGLNENSVTAMRDGFLKSRKKDYPEPGFWKDFKKSSARYKSVQTADKAYELYVERLGILTAADVANYVLIDIKGDALTYIRKILNYFAGGWIPEKDPLWIRDFKE